MSLDTYIWNLSFAVFGVLMALDYTIQAARTTDKIDRVVHFFFAQLGGLVGVWNLICLLVKLNVIRP